ncbi:ion transporter [Acidobacteriota bacterium]
MKPRRRKKNRLKAIHDFLDKELVKIVLSGLIIISVLPEGVLPQELSSNLSLVFFFIFALEFILRLFVFFPAYKEGRSGRGDLVLLALDLIATLSFLPVELIYPPVKGLRVLRLFRLMRIFLLFRYWGATGKEIWIILMKRKYQILFAASVVLILSFVGSIILSNIEDFQNQGAVSGENTKRGFDYNEDGQVNKQDKTFSSILWWTFRQIQDPGNLIKKPRGGIILLLSIILTIVGLFLFSFIIGIGTSVVDELVSASYGRRIGMSDHSAILNISHSTDLLLLELKKYYMKHFRKAKIAVLGTSKIRPDYLFRSELRRVRYRWGNPSLVQDLTKVDADRASRVILLGDPKDPDSDAKVVSQILSTRQLNPDGLILAEIIRECNLRAAAEAAGDHAIPIPLFKILGLFLTNIILFPGFEDVFREILTSTGQEIYTVIYGEGSVSPLSDSQRTATFGDLFRFGATHHGIILIGVLVPAEEADGRSGDLKPVLNPDPSQTFQEPIRGIVGLARQWGDLRDLALDYETGDITAPSGPSSTEDGLPSFRLNPEISRIKKVLICNFSEWLIEFVEQLTLFLNEVEFYIMAQEETEVGRIKDLLITHTQRLIARGVDHRGSFERADTGLIYRIHGARSSSVPISVFTGDPAEEREFTDPQVGGFKLKDVDLMLFAPQADETSDSDAKTALGTLKMWNLQRSRPDLFHPSFRMVALVNEPAKGDLLERKGKEIFAERKECPAFTVLSIERIRNHFLAQAVFVRKIVDIYRDLLCESRQEIFRIVPDWTGGDLDQKIGFLDLLNTVYSRERLILIGVEILNPETGCRQLCLNPEPGDPGYRFRLGDLATLCVVGDTQQL